MSETAEDKILNTTQNAFRATCELLSIDPSTVNANFHLITAAEIKNLNNIYRGKDSVTDTLSFPLLEIVAGEKPTVEKFPYDINPDTNKLELGDIMVCEDEAEIAFLYVHSLLHLFGYSHDTESDYDAMMQLTQKIMEAI